jgi:threonine/homoserine/homoserine lactone efflux protein
MGTAPAGVFRPTRMPTLPTLLLFTVAVLGLMLSPGPNMAMVISQSLSHGARGGIVSAAGIFTANLLMTMLVCAGVTALVATWAPAFYLLRYGGAFYLVWLALQALRRHARTLSHKPANASLAQAFRSATLVSLLNPKALLFFLVFLPQFVDQQRGSVTLQLLVLGLTLSIIAFGFHALLGISSGRLASAFHGGPRSARWLDRLQAGIFLGLAIRLLFLERPLRL